MAGGHGANPRQAPCKDYGLQASKSTANGTTYFAYDGTTPALELNAAGVPTAWNTFGPLGLLCRRIVTPTNSYSHFYLFDATCNVANRQDAWQSVLSSCLYDAYGKWADPNSSENTDPFGYQGQAGYYRDSETGLYPCTFRYCERREARWLGPDPLGYEGGPNLYEYCEGDPVNEAEPLGRAPGDEELHIIVECKRGVRKTSRRLPT